MKKIMIPRNIMQEHDKFPIDFIINFDIETRQIPYLIIGGLATVFTSTHLPLSVVYKTIIGSTTFSTGMMLSSIKIEGQNLENIMLNMVKYNMQKLKIKRRCKNEKKKEKNK